MGKRLSQINQVTSVEKTDYLLVDGDEQRYQESKRIELQDIDINNFNTGNFYSEIEGNFVKKEGDKGLSSNDFTKEDKDKLDKSQEQLISGSNIKTINGESILGSGNIEVQGKSDVGSGTQVQIITWEAGD